MESDEVRAPTPTGSLFSVHSFVEALKEYHSLWNVLLVLSVIGVASNWVGGSPVLTFVCTFLGMLPLATILGQATETVAEHTNNTIGALVNVTFGNAVELILSIAAMRAGRVSLIQDTIVGSIVSNLLLVLGSSFLVGGMLHKEQKVQEAVSENNANMLLFSVFGFSVPALFAVSVPETRRSDTALESLSLVTAVVLLGIYLLFMVFQLHTHADLYDNTDEDEDGEGSESRRPDSNRVRVAGASPSTSPIFTPTGSNSGEEALGSDDFGVSGDTGSTPSPFRSPDFITALVVLVVTVILVSVSSELLVQRIDEFSHHIGLRQKFIAIVLLPVVANAVEHMSAVMVAGRNKIDMSIGIACGSSLQMALFVAPMLVVLSWMFGPEHLRLNFQLFETVCLGFTVLLVNATLRDSRTNWLEGALLLMCYFILTVAFFFVE